MAAVARVTSLVLLTVGSGEAVGVTVDIDVARIRKCTKETIRICEILPKFPPLWMFLLSFVWREYYTNIYNESENGASKNVCTP